MTNDRVKELEKEFIIWGNILDEELLRYHYHTGAYPRGYLLKEDAFFNELLDELDRKNVEYIGLTGQKYCHPNFEKSSWRLNQIIDLIFIEIESHRGR